MSHFAVAYSGLTRYILSLALQGGTSYTRTRNILGQTCYYMFNHATPWRKYLTKEAILAIN